MYNINTKLWTTRFNTTTNNNKYIMLQSFNIEDILEQSLNRFDINNKYDYKNLVTINKKELHNIKYYDYYIFISMLMKEEQNALFYKYKELNKNLHEHLWENIYSKYKMNIKQIELKAFLNKYIV